MTKDDKKKLIEMRNAAALNDYIQDIQYNHSDGCYHYTTLDIIDKILGNHEFYISNVSNFNDEIDKQEFGDHQERFYSLCFSAYSGESIALWYLYSGLDGKGGKIRFKDDALKALIDNGKYYLYELKGKIADKKIMELKNNENMKVKLKDIVYWQEDTKKQNIKLKHRGSDGSLSYNEFEQYQKENIGFYKKIIWAYESECRLLVELTGKALEVVTDGKKKGKEYVVVLDIPPSVMKSMWLGFAPEIKEADKNSKDIKAFANIVKFMDEKSKAKLSKHSGEIHMNLCQNCSEKTRIAINHKGVN